jgi:hypothetical protein
MPQKVTDKYYLSERDIDLVNNPMDIKLLVRKFNFEGPCLL